VVHSFSLMIGLNVTDSFSLVGPVYYFSRVRILLLVLGLRGLHSFLHGSLMVSHLLISRDATLSQQQSVHLLIVWVIHFSFFGVPNLRVSLLGGSLWEAYGHF
jgi:hypothetical protein